jgi:alkylation response protein AidB-like acyl-CoA dehydrogenase
MNLDGREKLLQDVESFCRQIRPIEDRCYYERRYNDQAVPLARQYSLMGIPIPQEYGGRGADVITYVRSLIRIGREGTALRSFFSGHTSIGQYPILNWGNAEQKRKYLTESCRDGRVMAFALTEPDAGSNPLEMRATYRRAGDEFLLNGQKYLITNGGVADTIVTFAYPEGLSGRISAFIVDARGPGYVAEELAPKIGMPTVSTARIELNDCAIPAANLLGDEGDGYRIALGTLISGRLSVAAGCLGVIEDCLAEAVGYARTRHQHGKPIARHQLVQDHIAAIEMARVTSEAVLMKAAEAKANLDAESGNELLLAQADLLAAQAKLHAAQAACDAADRATQVFGGRGYLEAYRPGRHLKDTRVCRLYEGTDEILKLKIAGSILGKEYQAFR